MNGIEDLLGPASMARPLINDTSVCTSRVLVCLSHNFNRKMGNIRDISLKKKHILFILLIKLCVFVAYCPFNDVIF